MVMMVVVMVMIIVVVRTVVTMVAVVAVTVVVMVMVTPPRWEYKETGAECGAVEPLPAPSEKQLVSLVDYVTLYNGCT
jgi:hypothetical protein